jgi:hypothetical protein
MEAIQYIVAVHNKKILLMQKANDWVVPGAPATPKEDAASQLQRIVFELTGRLLESSEPVHTAVLGQHYGVYFLCKLDSYTKIVLPKAYDNAVWQSAMEASANLKSGKGIIAKLQAKKLL